MQGINVYDILRRDTLVLTKAAVERWRSASNEQAIRATTTSSSPGDHREVDAGSEHNQVTFRVRLDATKPEIKAAVEGAVQRQGDGRQHPVPEGQDQALPRPRASGRT